MLRIVANCHVTHYSGPRYKRHDYAYGFLYFVQQQVGIISHIATMTYYSLILLHTTF